MICTADHHHAFIANWALNRGMHVYCEKPLGISVEEVRTVRANYLKNKAKLATQHGTQRHAFPNFERLRELILDGAIGELKTVHSWDSRQLPRPGYPDVQGMPPNILHYEQWIGPSPYHPYSPQYFGGSNGLNCLFWNMYRDFGVGQMGDMGAHTMDLVWNSIDAGAPIAVEVDQDVSDKYNPDITPVKLKVSFFHPANSWRGPIENIWYQGGLKPHSPKGFIDVDKIGNGAIFEGTKGIILADFESRLIIPNNDDGDLTYYKRRSKEDLLPLIQGTGYVTQSARRRTAPVHAAAQARPAARLHRRARRHAQARRFPGRPTLARRRPRRPGSAQSRDRADSRSPKERHPRRNAPPRHFPVGLDRRLQGPQQQCHPRHQQQDPLRLRLLRNHDGADAARPGGPPRRPAPGVRPRRRPRHQRAEANDYLKRTYRSGWSLNG